jgi:diacylglycerol O-acyltransferase
VSAMLAGLATELDDPVDRLRAIQGSTEHAKDQAGAIGADTLTNWAEFAAPAVAARAARLYSRMRVADRHRPIFNLVISNVPGPGSPIYMAGARLVARYPMGPINEGTGLNITVMSYLGTIHFGLVACPDRVEDVDDLAARIPQALEELRRQQPRRRDPPGDRVSSSVHADVAQLVEHHLAKVRVAGSNPVVRSLGSPAQQGIRFASGVVA